MTDRDVAAKTRLAEMLSERLAAINGVVAVVLGGSLAKGSGDSASDIDLGLYYEPEHPPSLDELRALAKELDDSQADNLVTPPGEWGPWINGGGWLSVEGERVDWLYRDLERVRTVISEVCAGQPAIHYQPGHPHGFHTAIYAAEVHTCRILQDPYGLIAGLKAQTIPYPPALRKAITSSLWEADFALSNAEKAIARGDVSYVAGCFFRCVATLSQVLHAVNRQYCMNEKGAVRAASMMQLSPPNFEPRVVAAFAQLDGPGGLVELRALTDETRALCELSEPRVSNP